MADQINTEEEREKFEAWADGKVSSLRRVLFGGYFLADAQCAWQAWQARALLSASQPVAGQGWMPIETAPHNERVLVYSEGLDEVTIGWQDRIDGKWYFAPQGGVIPWVLTGWRRLYEGAALSQPSAGTAGVAEAPSDEAEFELHAADGICVAAASGQREEAWREIQHYAVQYAKEGPLTIYEVTRKPVSVIGPDASRGGERTDGVGIPQPGQEKNRGE